MTVAATRWGRDVATANCNHGALHCSRSLSSHSCMQKHFAVRSCSSRTWQMLGMTVAPPAFHPSFAQGALASTPSCGGGNLAADSPGPGGRVQGACVGAMVPPLARGCGPLPGAAVVAPPPAHGALVRPACAPCMVEVTLIGPGTEGDPALRCI